MLSGVYSLFALAGLHKKTGFKGITENKFLYIHKSGFYHVTLKWFRTTGITEFFKILELIMLQVASYSSAEEDEEKSGSTPAW